jgi:hypothetical protein
MDFDSRRFRGDGKSTVTRYVEIVLSDKCVAFRSLRINGWLISIGVFETTSKFETLAEIVGKIK